MVDSWMAYRPVPPYKSYSSERLNQQHPQVLYSFRSPAPSPVHTPSGSPILSRTRGSSPALPPGRPQRRMIPPIPPPKNVAASKPPRPLRQRPALMKAKTIDCPEGFDNDPFQPERPLEAGNKIPSLDSLYEQLKAFAASTPPPTPTGSSSCRPSRVDNQLAADLAAAALEMVANSPLVRSRSATFSGPASPFNCRPKVFIDSAPMDWQPDGSFGCRFPCRETTSSSSAFFGPSHFGIRAPPAQSGRPVDDFTSTEPSFGFHMTDPSRDGPTLAAKSDPSFIFFFFV